MAPAKRVPTAAALPFRHSAIGPQLSMKHWRLSHNQVSTKSGEGHLLV